MVTTRHAANVQLEAEFMLLYISLKVLEFPDFFRLTSFPEKSGNPVNTKIARSHSKNTKFIIIFS